MAELQPIDPAFAAALDRFAVPEASDGFADRIAAAAVGGPREAAPARRDRRGGWTRRAVAMGAALVLGTSAIAAAVLEQVGIPVPIVHDLFAGGDAKEPERHAAQQKHQAKAAPVHKAEVPAAAVPAPVADVKPVDQFEKVRQVRRAIAERIMVLPPAQRRRVVGRMMQRASIRRQAMREGVPPAVIIERRALAAGIPPGVIAERRAERQRRWRAIAEERAAQRGEPVGVQPGPAPRLERPMVGPGRPLTRFERRQLRREWMRRRALRQAPVEPPVEQ